jgi:hypothetical protein
MEMLPPLRQIMLLMQTELQFTHQGHEGRVTVTLETILERTA